MPMVKQIAAKHFKAGIELDDLVGAGNIGLVRATQTFDPNRGYKFTTYSSYWIRAYIFQAIERRGGGTLTRGERRAFYHKSKARRVLEARGIDEPTDAQIAEHLKIAETAIASLDARKMYSLDAFVPHTADSQTWLENTPDAAPSPEELLAIEQETEESYRELYREIDKLSLREQEVIRTRWFAEEKETLDEIGRKFGISRERVRQIELRALRKLRANLLYEAA